MTTSSPPLFAPSWGGNAGTSGTFPRPPSSSLSSTKFPPEGERASAAGVQPWTHHHQDGSQAKEAPPPSSSGDYRPPQGTVLGAWRAWLWRGRCLGVTRTARWESPDAQSKVARPKTGGGTGLQSQGWPHTTPASLGAVRLTCPTGSSPCPCTFSVSGNGPAEKGVSSSDPLALHAKRGESEPLLSGCRQKARTSCPPSQPPQSKSDPV